VSGSEASKPGRSWIDSPNCFVTPMENHPKAYKFAVFAPLHLRRTTYEARFLLKSWIGGVDFFVSLAGRGPGP